VLIEPLRSWQLSRKKREKKLNGGGGGPLLAWPTTAASLQITMEIHISNWTHKFRNRTGLDAKANSELYKSNRVCSVYILVHSALHRQCCGPRDATRLFLVEGPLPKYPGS
jgi:hypothetical protein